MVIAPIGRSAEVIGTMKKASVRPRPDTESPPSPHSQADSANRFTSGAPPSARIFSTPSENNLSRRNTNFKADFRIDDYPLDASMSFWHIGDNRGCCHVVRKAHCPPVLRPLPQ
ncbi:hypothetical protein Snov_2654 [Ancylobacter novellus DSM 506]|uniref:Uncharacterized protein n=1 Tax=Ancylobacter novellus (strain ATCC 8093 / DSM 506 / JCM 20403 / CCM 1077 / IAM 12100 / NBRC 12443 / NCIMB 10456) TaxID=639283 RepID=D7A560_ANCN5|nr:hypothetical protein Snov_2654 [Ancylobacter novellus DSM 506]